MESYCCRQELEQRVAGPRSDVSRVIKEVEWLMLMTLEAEGWDESCCPIWCLYVDAPPWRKDSADLGGERERLGKVLYHMNHNNKIEKAVAVWKRPTLEIVHAIYDCVIYPTRFE